MPTISQRIALEGAEEIRRQLDAVGKAGKASFEQIEAAGISAAQGLDRVVGAVARVERSFTALNASARAFGSSLAGAGQAFGAFEGAILRSVRNIGLLTAAVGGAAAGFGLLVKGAVAAADNIGEQAAGLGITTESYQKLSAAATDSGIGQEQFGRALGNLAKLIKADAEPALKAAEQALAATGFRFAPTAAGAEAAGQKIGQLAKSFQEVERAAGKGESALAKLGVATVDASGTFRGVDEVFLDVAEALSKLPDGVDKTTIAMELFGARFGRAFIDFINKGKTGIQDLGKAFGQLRFSDAQIQISDRVAAQLEILGFTAKRAKDQLALLFAPSLGQLAGALTETILRNFGTLRAGIDTIVRDHVEPAVRDLIRIISGKDEPLETTWIQSAVNGLRSLGDAAAQAGQIIGFAFGLIRSAASSVAGAINSVFGTNISGDALLVALAVLKVTGALSLLVTGFGLAGAASLLFLRTLGLVVSGIRVLLAGLGAFAALTNPFVTIIAGLVLLGAAFLLVGQDGRRIMGELFADLLELAGAGLSALGDLIRAKLREAFNIKPDESLTVGLFIGLFNAIGKAASDLGNFLGAKIAQGITSALGRLPASLGGNYFAGLSEQFAKTAADIVGQAEKVGAEVGAAVAPKGDAVESFFKKYGELWEAAKKKSEALVTGQKDVGTEAENTANKFVASSVKIVDATGRQIQAIKKFKDELASAKAPDLGPAGGGGGGGGGGAVAGGLDNIGSSASGASDKVKDLRRSLADLNDEEVGLRRAALFEKDSKKLAEIEGKIERNRILRKRAGEDLRKAELDHLSTLEKEAAAEREAGRAAQKRLDLEKAARRGPIPGLTPGGLQIIQAPQRGAQQVDEAGFIAMDQAATRAAASLDQLTLDEMQRSQALDVAAAAPVLPVDPVMQGITEAAGQLDTALDGLNSTVQSGAVDLDAAIEQQAQAIESPETQEAFREAADGLQQELQSVDLDSLKGASRQLESALEQLSSATQRAASELDKIQAGGGGGDLEELAGGGMIRGPGTATSDSILARLSRGEYVVRAAAVRHYGPALLSALNSLRIPRPTGFNLGGLVEGMQRSLSALTIPRFAAGGLAEMSLGGGGRPIALTINAGGERQTFHVWADNQVADSVVRYATRRQVAAAGRKSGAFG